MDYKSTARKISSGLAAYANDAGYENAVIGLSGGLDSSTTAYLAAEALGESHVFGVILPSAATRPADVEHALLVARQLGIDHYRFNISDIAHAVSTRIQGHGLLPQDNMSTGNITARLRSIFLYNLAARRRALVLGTGDRSELLLGYFTKHGDGACDLLPIGSLYKTDVRKLAHALGVPSQIISKPSSPSLWSGQTAESELGASYEKIDEVLRLLFDKKLKPAAAAKKVRSRELVDRVLLFHERSMHKRKMPPIL
ncbi:MAG: NAD+ synthase [Candidatus Micrarchaeia archaeon]|jgi:NAD+ synthase